MTPLSTSDLPGNKPTPEPHPLQHKAVNVHATVITVHDNGTADIEIVDAVAYKSMMVHGVPLDALTLIR